MVEPYQGSLSLLRMAHFALRTVFGVNERADQISKHIKKISDHGGRARDVSNTSFRTTVLLVLGWP